MRRLLPLAVCITAAAGACDRQPDGVVARVGDVEIRHVEVAQRAARASLTLCEAVDALVDEEALVQATCATERQPACRDRDRNATLQALVDEESGRASVEEVLSTSRESAFLNEQVGADRWLPAALSEARGLRARMRERARRARASVPITIPDACRRVELDGVP